MRAIVIEADWAPRAKTELTPDELERRSALDGTQVWRHPRWSLGQRPDPAIAAEDHIIVRSRAVGICGSDVHMYETDADGYVLLPYKMRMPLVPGHEVAGEVVETGPAVRSLRPGDPVAVETLEYCDRCAACRRGLFNQCANAHDRGFDLDGGMAEYLLTTERHARPLAGVRERFDEQATYEIGALCEPASVAFVGMFVQAGGFLPGSTVTVFGCGPIGLASIALARCAGAARVIAFDPQPVRCQLARDLGADIAYDTGELETAGTTPASRLLEDTRGAGADLVIDASNAGQLVRAQIESALAVGAKVLYLGVTPGSVPMRTMAYQARAASAFGMLGHLGGFDPVIALHAAGRLDLSPIVTARWPLAEAACAIRLAGDRANTKIQLVPDDRVPRVTPNAIWEAAP
jgi:threonine dehydrogenase-like Zn-dependent dehydrogenase